MSKKKTTKQFYSPLDWEVIKRDDDFHRMLNALEGTANIRPFGDNNTAYERLCQEYSEYLRQPKLRTKKRKK